jgi:hypothetical protein
MCFATGRFWRKAAGRSNVRSRGQSGKHMLPLSFSAFDPQRTLHPASYGLEPFERALFGGTNPIADVAGLALQPGDGRFDLGRTGVSRMRGWCTQTAPFSVQPASNV